MKIKCDVILNFIPTLALAKNYYYTNANQKQPPSTLFSLKEGCFYVRILFCPLSFDTRNIGLLANKGLFPLEEAIKKEKANCLY